MDSAKANESKKPVGYKNETTKQQNPVNQNRFFKKRKNPNNEKNKIVEIGFQKKIL